MGASFLQSSQFGTSILLIPQQQTTPTTPSTDPAETELGLCKCALQVTFAFRRMKYWWFGIPLLMVEFGVDVKGTAGHP